MKIPAGSLTLMVELESSLNGSLVKMELYGSAAKFLFEEDEVLTESPSA
jgi:hypothetical protein